MGPHRTDPPGGRDGERQPAAGRHAVAPRLAGESAESGSEAKLTQVLLSRDQSATLWPRGREGRVVLSASAREPANGRVALRLHY